MKLPHGLRAFAHKNFRLFITGQGTSQVGNWLQLITTSWLMYRLSGSTLWLGLAAFAQQIPFLVLAPAVGVFLDRLDVRRVLMVTNTIALLQSLAMLTLVATGTVQPIHLVLGNLVLGIVNACDAPARQSLMVRLVDKREDLVNAIALNSAVMNGARFLGPMIGGFVIASFGDTAGFGLNSVLRFAVIAALVTMTLTPRVRTPHVGSWLNQFAAGVKYAYGFLPTRTALLLLAATSFTIQGYSSLMPWFAREVFHGDAHTQGTLIGCAGFGALAGMVYLAMRPSVLGLFRLIGITAAIAGASLVAFSFTHEIWLAAPLLVLVGSGMMLTAGSTNTVLQVIVPDELRGRVASLYVVSFLGVSPLGALFVGWLSEHIGPPWALAACGSGTVLASALYLRRLPAIREAMRPIYQKLGITRNPPA